MQVRSLSKNDGRFAGRLLLYTACGLFVMAIAIVTVSFFASKSAHEGTVMDWRPPSMTGDAQVNGELELLTQRWIAWIALVALSISVASVALLLATLRQQRRAADAAVATFEHNRKMGEAQTRAYVYPDYFFVPSLQVGTPLRVDYVVKNLGLSPAFEIVRGSYLTFERVDAPRRRNFYGERRSIIDTLPQGTELRVVLNRKDHLREEELHQFLEGRYKLVAYGYIFYRDIFGRIHRKTFSHELHRQGWREDGPMEMSLSTNHNRTSLPDRIS